MRPTSDSPSAPWLASASEVTGPTRMIPKRFALAWRCPRTRARLCLAAGLLSAAACAAAPADDLRYRQDMQDCREGRSAQSRTDCELEARHALSEAQRGALGPPGDAAAQALRRCAVFKHDGDHADCLARQAPQAHTSGTVQGGAVLRDVATPTAAPDLPF